MSLKDPKNQQILNDFFSEHAPLIHKQVKTLRAAGKIPKHIEDEDLHFAGIHGLVDAVHKYDHDVASRLSREGENPFIKYAEQRIRGKMLDHAAAQDVVPKQLRTRAKNLAAQAAGTKASKPEDETP
jgi:DNA-directed RNA polymerase specialized sigma subunit